MFKKEVMEQYEKEFFKAVKQARLFTEGFDLNLFDPFKDVKDKQLLDKDKTIVVEESNKGEEDDRVNVQAMPLLVILLYCFCGSVDNVFLQCISIFLLSSTYCFVNFVWLTNVTSFGLHPTWIWPLHGTIYVMLCVLISYGLRGRCVRYETIVLTSLYEIDNLTR